MIGSMSVSEAIRFSPSSVDGATNSQLLSTALRCPCGSPVTAAAGVAVDAETAVVRSFYAQADDNKSFFGGPLGGCSVTEATPLTGSGKVLSLAAKTWQGVAAEFQRARRALVTSEKDLEEGGASNAFSLFSVTIRKPLTPSKLAAVGYSYLPFVFFFFVILRAISTWNVLPFYAAVFLTLLNEHLFKRWIQEPRPSLSLVKSPGMPSSHCLVSYAYMVWIFLEAAVSPSSFLPRLLCVSLAVASFAPMPWARYYLDDHSEMQCLVGCLGGAFGGVIVFLLRHLALPAASAI
ncbi:uncharacterized protein LOC34620702 [Cyclospora cayetanensis]|uniref:Uncharacterized protein LOC34620702 n=1 Tax=Cyclospora cayetanensis TaxID=88456 RepID=A0A6P6RWX9_9EIME|nr:uncharacterized protein LOC34620702 [Cyclospora cayetanensis]